LLKVTRKLVPNINDYDKYISFPEIEIDYDSNNNPEYMMLEFKRIEYLDCNNIIDIEVIRKWKL